MHLFVKFLEIWTPFEVCDICVVQYVESYVLQLKDLMQCQLDSLILFVRLATHAGVVVVSVAELHDMFSVVLIGYLKCIMTRLDAALKRC